jgi:hypothetical protein
MEKSRCWIVQSVGTLVGEVPVWVGGGALLWTTFSLRT